jgi:hypothetical protein
VGRNGTAAQRSRPQWPATARGEAPWWPGLPGPEANGPAQLTRPSAALARGARTRRGDDGGPAAGSAPRVPMTQGASA